VNFGRAEQGCEAFPEDWRLQDDLLRCCERGGLTAQALALRRRQFERSPSVERFQAVLKAGTAAGQNLVALRQTLIDLLVAMEDQAMHREARHPAPFRASWAAPSTQARDVSLRAEVLCAEARWGEACDLVQPPSVCRNDVLHQIARHLPADQSDEAKTLLLRVFSSAMLKAGSPYRDELALVHEIGQRMKAAQRAVWLAQLRAAYKAKRNFIRGLPDR